MLTSLLLVVVSGLAFAEAPPLAVRVAAEGGTPRSSREIARLEKRCARGNGEACWELAHVPDADGALARYVTAVEAGCRVGHTESCVAKARLARMEMTAAETLSSPAAREGLQAEAKRACLSGEAPEVCGIAFRAVVPGELTPGVDVTPGLPYLEAGCAKHDLPSCTVLAVARGMAGDWAGGADALRGPCEAGQAQACGMLAEVLVNPANPAGDAAAGVGYASRGCDGGDANACGVLGVAYARGWGVERDARRALPLFQTACAGGVERACPAVKAMEAELTGPAGASEPEPAAAPDGEEGAR